jgi:signal transduction histidine kinase
MAPDRLAGEPAAGILAQVSHLAVWLHVTFVAAAVASAIRYVEGHGFDDRAPLVLGGAVVLLGLYAVDPRRVGPRRVGPAGSAQPARGHLAIAWCVSLIAVWTALVVIAPSFAWVAVPLAFVALQVLPFAGAAVAIATMTATVAVAWSAMQDRVDPTVVVGPASVAALTVVAYRALERESQTRHRLLEELRAAHVELSEAQHTAGAMAERARLSRDLHDSVAQGLSSINLLLQAANQQWAVRPAAASEYVHQAALTAREGLDDVRLLVRDLAPDGPPLQAETAALAVALRRACRDALVGVDVNLEVHVHGLPLCVPPDLATAVLHSARGAIANVVEHAVASNVVVSLTYQPDAVILDVCDDGRGFDPAQVTVQGTRGRGLAGMAARAREHGGELVVESQPGGGTALAVSLPVRRQ